MYIRQCFRTVEGERRAYWALVESVRTERGPRQNVVALLSERNSERASSVTNSPTTRTNCSSSINRLASVFFPVLLLPVNAIFIWLCHSLLCFYS